jgi:putative NADH-flavin reductase
MKIVHLGANGAVGQLALEELLRTNHDVTALVRNAPTCRSSILGSMLCRENQRMPPTWKNCSRDKTRC